MADEKSKGLFNKEKIGLQAKDGFVFPMRYQGAWIRVRSDVGQAFVVKLLGYQVKLEIRRALSAGHLVEVDPTALAVPVAPVAPRKTVLPKKAPAAAKSAVPAPKAPAAQAASVAPAKSAASSAPAAKAAASTSTAAPAKKA